MKRPETIPRRIFRLLRGGLLTRVKKFRINTETFSRSRNTDDTWTTFDDDENARSGSKQENDLARHYAALELSPDASLEEIKAAYKRLMKRYHPDKFQDAEKKETATELVKRLNEAYTELLKAIDA